MAGLLLLTASGLARETLSSIEQTGDHQVVGVLDDNKGLHGKTIGGVPVLGGLEQAETRSEQLLVCAGKGTSRAAIAGRLERMGVGKERYATHTHASAIIGARTKVGPGSIVLAGCVATCDVTIGSHVVLMPHVTLTHDDVLGDFATIAAGATLAGRVKVGHAAYLGTRSAVREDVTIGEDAVLGMGAVLLTDLPAGQVWVGNPARRLIDSNLNGSDNGAPDRRENTNMIMKRQGAKS